MMGVTTAIDTAAQTPSSVPLQQRDMCGPRLGVTYVPGHGKLWQTLEENNVGRLISQFGWHFEYQVRPELGGPQFVIQAIPLVAGVEYGKLIPSATLAMGIRLPNGQEFGMGPNAIVTKELNPINGMNEIRVKTALVIAIGKSFNYGGVSIPVNLVGTTSREGNRFSFIVGYAIERSTRTIGAGTGGK